MDNLYVLFILNNMIDNVIDSKLDIMAKVVK